MNILANACDAIPGTGNVWVTTRHVDGAVVVEIRDDGGGMPPDVMSRIFDPFFTTKDQGEGTGLGLGIAQQIVQRHRGEIRVDSEPGRTCFEVRLPLTPVAAASPEAEA